MTAFSETILIKTMNSDFIKEPNLNLLLNYANQAR